MVMFKVNSANEVTVTPSTPVFGAEVEGVQVASATPEQLDAIKEAFGSIRFWSFGTKRYP